jgi:hypothetical protein
VVLEVVLEVELGEDGVELVGAEACLPLLSEIGERQKGNAIGPTL